MSFRTHFHPEYLTSDLISVPHCFSTRFGGVSSGHLSSLNLGIHRGDLRENVLENYRILGQAVGFSPEQTVFTHQTHTDIVVRVGARDRSCGLYSEVTQERDGLITDEPGVALTVFSADCTPILLYDPVKRAVGAVHAGWRGTAKGIAARCVQSMAAEFGSDPEDLRAAIGPCIGPCCFETDRDVPEAMLDTLGDLAAPAIHADGNGKYHVDLKQLNKAWLRQTGVRRIDISADCTACQPDRFWSHRRVGNQRGSLAAVIMLPE